MIMAGRVFRVLASGQYLPVDKPGSLFPLSTKFSLKPGKVFVSRGAYKLLTLLDNFNLDMENKVCLDAGASTGGFTDCLLQRNAARVYAIDVGANQLHEKLRSDPRVVSLEGVNLRYAPENLITESIDFLTGDVSFISLTLILPVCLKWLKPGGQAGILIKPQFELSPEEVNKGVVRDEALQKKAVKKIEDFCIEKMGLVHLGSLPASIKGPKGNQEYMALFQKPAFGCQTLQIF